MSVENPSSPFRGDRGLNWETALSAASQAFQAPAGAMFNHARSITIPFGSLSTVLDWCHDNLTDDWRWQLGQTLPIDSSNLQTGSIWGLQTGFYIFYFNNDADCMIFTLKWT